MTLLGIFDHLMTPGFWSHWLWAFLFGLLGFFLGWLVWGRLVSRLREQVAKLEGEIADWRKKYEKLQKEYAALEGELKDARLKIDKQGERIRQLELEKGQLHGDLMAARQVRDAQGKELDALKSRFTALEEEKMTWSASAADTSELDALRAKLNESNTLNASLRSKVGQLETNVSASSSSAGEVGELKAKLATAEATTNAHQRTIRDLNVKLSNAGDTSELDGLRAKLNKTQSDLAACQAKASAAPAAGAGFVAGAAGAGAATGGGTNTGGGAPLSKEEKKANAERAKQKVKARMASSAGSGGKDDLKLISGVGPALEKKLNDLGIFTFKQVSEFDPEMVGTVNDAIEFFPGRVQRDDWVGQAKKLYQTKQSNPDALTGSKNPSNPEDLKVVEGIGPKIEQLLKNDGIRTWRDLANAKVDRLKGILEAAGDRYRIHDPGTWAEQAQLAADGDWDKLKEYQDFLQGGRTS